MSSLLSDMYTAGFTSEGGPERLDNLSRAQPATGGPKAGRRAAPFACDDLGAELSETSDFRPRGEATKSEIAPWEKDAGTGIGHNPRRRTEVHGGYGKPQHSTHNTRARAIQGLPPKVGGGVQRGGGANREEANSPLSRFMAGRN